MGYYKLHTQGPLHSSGSGTQQLISALTFIPQISIHKAAVFKCQVSYIGKDRIMVERVSEKFSILCKIFFIIIIPLTSSLLFRNFNICNTKFCIFPPPAAPEVSEIQLAETANDPGEAMFPVLK